MTLLKGTRLMVGGGLIALVVGLGLLRAELGAPGPMTAAGIAAIACLATSPSLVIVGWILGRYAEAQHRIHQTGVPGEGRILSMRETGMKINGKRVMALDIEMNVDTAGVKQGVARERIPAAHAERISVGSVVPVRVDRQAPHRMVIDWQRLGSSEGLGRVR